MKRRDFLKKSITSLTNGYLFLNSPLSYSFNLNSDNSNKILVVKIPGGMDSLSGLNPWIKSNSYGRYLSLQNDYDFKKNIAGTDINLAYAAYPLNKHAQDIAVINGVFMAESDLGHLSLSDYIGRGSAPTDPQGVPYPDFIVNLANQLTPEERFVVASNQKINSATLVSNFRYMDINRPINDEDNIVQSCEKSVCTNNSPFNRSLHNLLKGKSELEIEKDNYTQKVLDELASTRPESLSQIFNDMELLENSVATLASGKSNFVQISFMSQQLDGGTVDSHDDHERNQYRAQIVNWKAISHLFDLLKSTPLHSDNTSSVFDKTTVVVLNEFSRLPFLNDRNGKDHNPFDNSILLAGNGIKGGTMLGGSQLVLPKNEALSSNMIAYPIDYKTKENISYKPKGQTKTELLQEFNDFIDTHPNVDFIRPENIWATIASMNNIDLRKIRSFSEKTRVLPGLIK